MCENQMTSPSALDTFRNPPPELSITPLGIDISNTTGAKDYCGVMPDVYGNNAYFNSMCLKQGGLSAKGLFSTIAETDIAAGAGPSIPPGLGTATTLTPFGTNTENTDPTVFTLNSTGILVNYTGNYLIMLTLGWANATTGAGTTRVVDLLFQGSLIVQEFMTPITSQLHSTSWQYGINAGTQISIQVAHNEAGAQPSPAVGVRMILLGS